MSGLGPVEVRMLHRARPGRGGEVRDLLGDLEPLLARAGVAPGARRVRELEPGLCEERFTFASREAFEEFDELFTKDRRAGAVWTLLDELLDPLGCDFELIEMEVSA